MADEVFTPIRGNHAIVEMAAFLQFASQLPDEVLSRSASLQTELKATFPAADLLTRLEVKANAAGILAENPIPSMGGIELKRFKPDGEIAWMLHFSQDGIRVHCLEYAGWSEVWGQVEPLLASALEKLGGSRVEIAAVGIKYIDRFYAQAAQYDASKLFQRDSVHLSSNSFSGGDRWHCHTGWYLPGEDDVLSQLNIDSVRDLTNKNVVVTVDHTLQQRASMPGQLGRFKQPPSDKVRYWTKLADRLHNLNKTVLTELLTDDMSKRIGLL